MGICGERYIKTGTFPENREKGTPKQVIFSVPPLKINREGGKKGEKGGTNVEGGRKGAPP